jgi:hypothetical protein
MAFPHDGKKFKPGESGNLKGRTPIIPIKEVINQNVGSSGIVELIEKLHDLGMSGNVKAIEILLAYSYGKSPETIDLRTTNTTPDYHEFLKHLKDPNV